MKPQSNAVIKPTYKLTALKKSNNGNHFDWAQCVSFTGWGSEKLQSGIRLKFFHQAT